MSAKTAVATDDSTGEPIVTTTTMTSWDYNSGSTVTASNGDAMTTTWGDRPERKIAIVGFTGSREQAPWDDPSWELWGLNNLHIMTPWQRCKRWYDLHDDRTIESDEQHVAWLRSLTNMPVYVWQTREEWPTSVQYPRELVTKEFGSYFTNSVSWMLAHAILEGATTIGVWGIDMAQGGEYSSQRPSCEYFLGLAAGLGITIEIADTSDLLKTAGLYGAETTFLRLKLEDRDKELRARLAEAEQQFGNVQAVIHQLRGALESNAYILNVWTQPHVKREEPASP